MGLPNPPMDEFAPYPPLCRNCILEVDGDGYCSSCGRLVPASALTLEVINGGRGESFQGSSAPAARRSVSDE